MSLKEKTLTGLGWNTASSLVTFGMQTLQLIILTRLFAPEVFGIMGLVLIVSKFSDIFLDMGISNAIIQRKDIDVKDLSSLFYLNLITGFILAGIIFGGSGLIGTLLKEPKLTNYLEWISIIYFITPFGQQYRAIFQKRMEFNIIERINIIAIVISVPLTIYLAYNGYNVYSLIYGQIANAFIRTLLLIYEGRKVYTVMWYYKYSRVKRFLAFGIYQAGESILNYINTNIDGISIGRFVGPAALGYYNAAFNIIIIPSMRINPILTKVFFPAFSHIQDQDEKLKSVFFKLLNVLNFINMPIFVGLFILAKPFVLTVFGEKWLFSATILQILCGVGLLRSFGNPVGSLVYAKGKAKRIFTFNLYKIVIQVPAIVIGAYLGGVLGVAYTFLLLQVLFAAFSYQYLIKNLLGPSLKQYLNTFTAPFIWSVGMGVPVFLLQKYLTGHSEGMILLLGVLTGIGVYGVFFVFSKNSVAVELRTLLYKSLVKMNLFKAQKV
ncbi:polysaccharide transporter, PST family/lipopolysaccharide exporter [bacterium A37T11]|nr:polysaccharide transporter, PST family/lipopolysaccharide exporter [bacterium A37T11]